LVRVLSCEEFRCVNVNV
jgi:hypothetical protein